MAFSKHGWDPKYGSRWYLYRDGRPHVDDDNSYIWTGNQWVIDYEYEEEIDEDALEEWEHKRREKLAIRNEY